MKARSILHYSVALLLLTACSSDDDTSQVWTGEIRLKAIEAETPRATTTVQGPQFGIGQRVAVFLNEHDYDATADDKTDYPQPLLFSVADSYGNLQPYGGSAPYFPTNTEHGIDVYATYPSTVTGVGTFSVKAQQNTDADYMASDLMYGVTAATVMRTESTVPLTFRHQLAKVVVRIEAASGSPQFGGATVRLLRMKTQVPITKCDLEGMTIGEATGSTSDIVMTYNYEYDEAAPEANVGCAAVIVPQTLNEGRFIRITQTDGTSMFYRLHEPMTFEAGKVYTYVINVYQNSFTVNGEVAIWDDSDEELSAEIETE